MILRRVIKHFRHQEWTAIFLDFLIVVFGVLIAFQITTWNEFRQSLRDETILLERLRVDFAQIEDSVRDSTTFHRDALDGMQIIVDALNTQRLTPEKVEPFERGLRFGSIYWTSHDRSGIFIEALSSGKSSLIRDENLLNTLVDYNSMIDQMELGFSTNRAIQIEYIRDFTTHFDYDTSADYVYFGKEFPISAIGEYDFKNMVQDKKFRDAAYELRETQRYYLNWRTNVLNRVQAIRRLLGDEQLVEKTP
ncbi:MAG: hypothetical protein COA84_10260 [Robiginitomaculum sp.]|nr:MAG: hypothetical protein COA84_10260 [Robiginitomaculum sp.]